MKGYLRPFILACLIYPVSLSGQETGAGLSYQSTLIGNPAVTGSGTDGIIRLSYFNIYPGNNYNLHSVCVSYDGYFQALHGGAGIYISDYYMGGQANELRGGFSYSYFMQAGKDLFITAGLSAAFYHRGYNFSGAVLPDQIDPLGGSVLPSSEILASKGRTVLDLATGFTLMTGRYFGGIAVSHLSEPDLSQDNELHEKLRRRLLIHSAADFYPGSERKLKITPAGKLEFGGGSLIAAAGASVETNYMSVNSVLFIDNFGNLDVQAGFSVKTDALMVFYNYRFNIASGNAMLPFSLLHHTGIAFRLNSVDKRNAIKTINFPKL